MGDRDLARNLRESGHARCPANALVPCEWVHWSPCWRGLPPVPASAYIVPTRSSAMNDTASKAGTAGRMLPTDRIAYSAIADRPPLKLPGGARMAIWVIVNVEEWDPKDTRSEEHTSELQSHSFI